MAQIVWMIIAGYILACLFFIKRTNTIAKIILTVTLLVQGTVIFSTYKHSGIIPLTSTADTLIFASSLLTCFAFHFHPIIITITSLTIFTMGQLLQAPSTTAPVLQDNFWLALHVVIIILGYVFLLLAFALALSILFKKNYKGGDALFRILQIAAFLIGLGIILGASWAEVSWGIFWSWDPKEVWALMTFLVTVIILLAYQGSLIQQRGLALGTLITFSFMLMTWLGVNYLFKFSLHFYN